MRQRARATMTALTALTVVSLAACGGDDDTAETPATAPASSPATTPATAAPAGKQVVAGEPMPAERCDANRAAGTIHYYSGFDYAAAASLVEVFVAEAAGYYDALCLDVEITPSFSTANYPLVAANEAQFSSSGSFSELASYSAANEAELVAVTVDGHVTIDALLVKPDRAASLAELAGQTIGVKGAVPAGVAAMLAGQGLIEGTDFETVLVDGFDPTAHMAIEAIAALPGWKSNEPGALERAGVPFDLYDPSDYGIPGSFGLIYTNRTFLTEHPTAAEDFVRATLRGLADALATPDEAAATSVGLADAAGNPNFLSLEGETFRWNTEAALITDSTPAGSFPGVPASGELEAEVAAYDAVGLYPGGAPATDGRYEASLAAGVYADDGTIIWPA
jgi:hypothetical protein